MEVTVNAKKIGRKLAVKFDFGENIHEAVEKFGEEAVFNHFRASGKLSVNSFIRPLLQTYEKDPLTKEDTETLAFTDEQIRSQFGTAFKLTAKVGRSVDHAAKALAALQNLTPEKRAEIMAILSGATEAAAEEEEELEE